MKEISFIDRAGWALVGLLLGVFYLVWLMDAGEIELGVNWGPTSGTEWIPIVLFAAPTAGALLPDGVKRLPLVALLLLVMATPAVHHLFGAMRSGLASTTPEVTNDWITEARADLMAEVGTTMLLIEVPFLDAGCKNLLAWAQTPEGGVWYWYDGAQGRVTARVKEARLALLANSYLPPGDEVDYLTPYEGHPQRVAFTFTSPQGRKVGFLQIGQTCRFTLDAVDFVNPPEGVQAQNTPGILLTDDR